MSDLKIQMTDPARETAEFLGALLTGNMNKAGNLYLSEKFEVEPWGQDFYRTIAVIMDRLHFLKDTVNQVSMDADYRQEMVAHVDDIARAFTPSGFQNDWGNNGAKHLGPHNLQPLKGISGQVRQIISYPKLSPDELSALEAEVKELINWLEERQLVEQEFIRQALIEGLKHLVFRLERFQWLGWGYTLESLRAVIGAYLALERQGVDANVNPDAAAVLGKVGELIRSVYSKLQTTKAAHETADWLLRAYGAGSLLLSDVPAISGYLSAP